MDICIYIKSICLTVLGLAAALGIFDLHWDTQDLQLRHVAPSSLARDQTHTPCKAGWILNPLDHRGSLCAGIQSLSLIWLCDAMDRSTPGLPVHLQLPEFTQTHVQWVGDAIQPSHHLPSPSLLPSIFPSIRIFSSESALGIRWPNCWSFKSFLSFMSTESVMLSNLLILCHPLGLLPLQSFNQGLFQIESWLFASGGQRFGASASASVFLMNIQCWFPLGLIGLISSLSNGLSRVFSSTTIQKCEFFSGSAFIMVQLTSIHNHWKNHSFDYTDLCWQNNVSAF